MFHLPRNSVKTAMILNVEWAEFELSIKTRSINYLFIVINNHLMYSLFFSRWAVQRVSLSCRNLSNLSNRLLLSSICSPQFILIP